MSDKKCFVCGHSYEKNLELHHVYGNKYGEMKVLLCRNCHKIVTDNQNQIPTKIRKSDSRRNKDIFALASIGSLHCLMGSELNEIAKRMCKNEK